MINIKKSRLIALLSTIGIIIILLIIFIVRLVTLGNDYSRDLSYTYTQSLGSLNEYLSEIESALEKSSYVNTTSGQVAVASVLAEAGLAAKTVLSYLPFSENNSSVIEETLSTVADFGLYVETKSSKGESLTDEDYAIFETLEEHISYISDEFSEIEAEYASGNISIGQAKDFLYNSLNLISLSSFDDGISDLSTELSALPTMIYDGPFSDHIEQKKPLYLSDLEEISEDEAISIASEFLNIPEENLEINYLDNGNLSSYQISSKLNSEDEDYPICSIKITQYGGEILYFKKTDFIIESNLEYADALEKCYEYLTEMGYEDLKESYYVISDNTCTINFAATQDGVILYPDLIKMTIELGEGGMMEFTNTGFLMNNTVRDDITPGLSIYEATNSIKDSLTITNTEIAIIPTAGENEVLVYEFTCTDEKTETELLIYINAHTGYEEQIYIVTTNENGKLVN